MPPSNPTKVVITIDCLNPPNPCDLPQLIAMLENPANRNHITIEKHEL